MLLTPAQATIAKDKHRFRVICIGRRGGKTTLAVEEIKGKALSGAKRIAYIAPTYQQARDIAWELLVRELEPIIVKKNETRLEIEVKTLKGTNCLIVLRGWESVETLRGQAFDFIVIDEVAMMRNFWSNWQEVIRPTLTDTRGEVMFISTPKGFNHFYDLYNLQFTDNDFQSFHFTSYDNSYVPQDELDTAKAQMTPDRFAQEYLADFRKTEGLVYKEFDREKHIFDPDKLDDAYRSMLAEPRWVIAGVDFGFTNPAAVLTIKIDSLDSWWITDEWYKTGKTEAQIAEYIAAQKFNYVYPDPESPSAIQELTDRKVNVRDVIKGKDSIPNSINKVRELLKAGKLKVSKDCINTINEFETYSYPESKDERNEDERPLDAQNHAMDALRYAVMMFIPSGVESVATVYRPPMGEASKVQGRASVYRPL